MLSSCRWFSALGRVVGCWKPRHICFCPNSRRDSGSCRPPSPGNLGTFLTRGGNRQVIGPFLIILRVANRRAVTSETIASGDIGSFHVDRRRSMSGDNILSDGQPASPI